MAEKKADDSSPFDVSETEELLMKGSDGTRPDVERAAGQPAVGDANDKSKDTHVEGNMEVVDGVPAWTPEIGKWDRVIDPNGSNPHEIPIEVFAAQENARQEALAKARSLGLLRNDDGVNKPLEKPKDAETIRTHKMLSGHPLRRVVVPQNAPGQPQDPDVKVSINGYEYQIQRGVAVDVPEPVRHLLVSSGIILPEDQYEVTLYPQTAPQVIKATLGANG